MTIAEADTVVTDVALGGVMQAAVPPLAPLAMPKQMLTRQSGPLWRRIGAFISLLRRDLGRVG